MDDDPMNCDWYGILDIPFNATLRQIQKAYRKKSLTCHPDKNPDNKNAAIQFHQLTKIFEALKDENKRKAYDKIVYARNAAKQRNEKLDSERKKFKEDLEAKEHQANEKTDEEKLKERIERLRKEGSMELQKEINKVQTKVHLSQQNNSATIKVHWKVSKKDTTNAGYNKDILYRLFKKYGSINCVVLSKKPGSALIEFSIPTSASDSIHETGLESSPLDVEIIQAEKPKAATPLTNKINNQRATASSTANLSNERDRIDLWEAFVLKEMEKVGTSKRNNKSSDCL